MSFKNAILYLGLSLTFFFFGCPKKPETVVEQPFPLTIVFSGPLSEGNPALLPKDIINLGLPLQSDECKKTVFIPHVTLVRADLEPVKKIKLDPTPKNMDKIIGKVQNFFGSHTAAQIRAKTKRSLENYHIPDEINSPGQALKKKIEIKNVSLADVGPVWVCGTKPKWLSSETKSKTVSDIESLREEIAKSACEHHTTGDSFPEFVITYYKEDISPEPGAGPGPQFVPTPEPLEIPKNTQVKTLTHGIPKKVIVKMRDVMAYTSPSFEYPKSPLKFFRKYFIFETDRNGFLIGEATVPSSIIGWVRKQDVIEWNTNQAIFFVNKDASKRKPVRVWALPEDVGIAALANFEELLDRKETSEPFPILSTRKDLVEIAFLWQASNDQKQVETELGDVLGGGTIKRKDTINEMKRMDVVLVIDATKSMGPYLERTRAKLTTIVDSLYDPDLPVRTHIGVVAFRDYEDQDVTFTTSKLPLTDDREEVNRFLGGLTPDCVDKGIEEAVLEGLCEAANEMNWGRHSYRVMLLVGDAPPHHQNDVDTTRLRARNFSHSSGFFDGPLDRNIATIRKLMQNKHIQFYALGIGHRQDMQEKFIELVGDRNRFISLVEADQLIGKMTTTLTEELEIRGGHYERARRVLIRTDRIPRTESELESLKILNFNPEGEEAIQKGWFEPDIGTNSEVAVYFSRNQLQKISQELRLELADYNEGKENEHKILDIIIGQFENPGGVGDKYKAESIGDVRDRIGDLPFKPPVINDKYLSEEKKAKIKRLSRELNNVLILLYSDKLWNEYGEGWVPMDLLPGG